MSFLLLVRMSRWLVEYFELDWVFEPRIALQTVIERSSDSQDIRFKHHLVEILLFISNWIHSIQDLIRDPPIRLG